MAKPLEFETTIYHEKLAMKAWLGRALRAGFRPHDDVSLLVWELLITYVESLDDFEAAKEDMYKAAYDLATLALHDMSIGDVSRVYRDFLVEAMLDYEGSPLGDHSLALVRFSNIVSDAFREAGSDRLRRDLRRRRAQNMADEMRLAKRIQNHLLPREIPSIPGFDFAGRLIPTQEIGGDYWSFKDKGDGVVTLKLADITGHGIAAATLVAAVKYISGGFYEGSASVAEVIDKTNRVLTVETPRDVLVTMVYGWLRPATFELTTVNAGHSPAFICRGDVCIDIPPTGPVLGVTEHVNYGEQLFKLRKNDIIFLGSDGITEAGIPEPYGQERLKQQVLEASSGTADEIADAVVSAVMDYAPKPHDDISLVVLKVTGDPPQAE